MIPGVLRFGEVVALRLAVEVLMDQTIPCSASCDCPPWGCSTFRAAQYLGGYGDTRLEVLTDLVNVLVQLHGYRPPGTVRRALGPPHLRYLPTYVMG